MSANSKFKTPSGHALKAQKGQDPIVCLTAYTTPMARLVDKHCDVVLVGDSVGMVLHGFESTLSVTMDMMIMHGQAVRRGVDQALLVVDMPFGSYEHNKEQAFENAAQLMRKTGCEAVKLEGGAHMAETIAYLTQRGIPVMGHIGLTPQSVKAMGGYSVQGRGDDHQRIMEDAKAVEDAGAYAIVLEMVTQPLADEITKLVGVPTIGIGASVNCDGQILVVDDLLGLFSSFKPKFVKRYAELADEADAAIEHYAREVRARSFPTDAHVYAAKAKKS